MRFRNQALRLLPALLAFICIVGGAAPAHANAKYAGIVVDVNTGRTLYADNADARRYPASLTKIMTLYILFEELEAKRLTLESKLSVSANAAAQAPSKINVRAGSTIKVEDAILALTTKSANDVAVVVAENISGSVSKFATRMNRTARTLGMNSSTFRNPHGLPNSQQTSTARDFVKLAVALQDRFPTYYKYFSARSFTYKGARYRNHNRLLGSVQGVDGIKTGYTRASGFNLVSNVRRDGRHIVAVVMGGRTGASRDAHMRDLIARYLPKAERRNRTTDFVIADAVSTDDGEIRAVADIQVPKPRPQEPAAPAASALAYAGNTAPRDVVAAAMAVPAARGGEPSDATVSDPIAERISGATEVAELAYVQAHQAESRDAIARLTAMAKLRAGAPTVAAPEDIVAGPRTTSAEGEAGWHIQIGAVPTQDGANELIENARESMGVVLVSLQPFTQPVEKDGTTLYRARFAGLSDKDEARAVCAKLKSKSFSCLAVQN